MVRNALLNPSLRKGFILPAVIVVLMFLTLLFTTSNVQAANGIQKTINFQGKVTNTDGTNVADGAYDFEIKIYDGAGNGASTLFTETWSNAALFTSTMSSAPTTSDDTLVYSSNTNEASLKVGQILWNMTKEEAVVITSVNTGTNTLGISRTLQNWANGDTITNRIYVKDGVFRVAINSLNTDLSGVNFGTDSLFVGVNFDTDGEMKPRMQLKSNAYAFNAEKVNGLTVTNTSDAAFSSATTLKIGDGKTVIINNGLTFSGTDATAFTFPNASGTVVTLDAAQMLTNKTIGNTGLTFENSESISNGTDGTLTFGRNDAGTVTLTAADNDSTAALTILPGGAAGLTLGGVSMTSLIVTTDGTGNDEVQLPTGSISSTEFLDGSLLPIDLQITGSAADEACLTYESTGAQFEWQTCGGGSQWVDVVGGISYDGGVVGIGTTDPVRLLQVHADIGSDSTFGLSDGDVAHGLTSYAPTNSWLDIISGSSTNGGALIGGISSSGTVTGLGLEGVIGVADPTDTTPAISLTGYKSNGSTNVTALGNDETVLQILNSTNPLMTILGSGNVGIGGNPTTGKLVLSDSTAALTVDAQQILASTGTTTTGVDGLQIDFANAGSGAIDNAGLRINVTSNNSNASSVLYGLHIGNLTSGGESADETALHIGTGWDRGLVIESGSNDGSGFVYSGGGRPTKTITLSPEYPGAVLTAFYGAGTDTNVLGNMTSDTDTTQGTSIRNYYQWERDTSTQHFYTVAVRVTLPKDFSAWATSNALVVHYITESATSTNSDLDVRVYNENSATIVASSTDNASTSWSTITIDDSVLDDGASSEWDAADEVAVIYLRMGSQNGNYVRVGDIQLNYLAAF